MKEDIDNGYDFFKSVVDPNYIVMNYPYGGYNDDVFAYAREIGCKLGFSAEARHANLDTNDFPPKRFEIWYVNIK